MNQPAVPLFLTHRVSDHSQLSEWPTVPSRRRSWVPVRRRAAPSGRATA